VTHQLRPPDGPPLFPSPQVGQADMTTPALATTGLEVRIHVLALHDHRTERNGDTSAIVGRAAASLPAGTTACLPHHPRGLGQFLEALVAWYGRPLTAVLDADVRDVARTPSGGRASLVVSTRRRSGSSESVRSARRSGAIERRP